jgi:hypothetical protein
MERPDVSAMNDLEAIIDEVHATEEYQELLRQRLESTLVELAAQLGSPQKRRDAANYLYWMVPEVKATSLAEALGGASFGKLQAAEYFHAAPADLTCEACGNQMWFSSRTKLHEAMRDSRKGARLEARGHPGALHFKVRCDRCRVRQAEERTAEWEQEWQRRNGRLLELRRMSYSDYRRTLEWKETRAEYLEETGGRCEACATSREPLNVYHRTVERQGRETASDLVTLCEDCASLLIEAGKLPDFR